jgi:hypothetical protein
VHWPPPFDDPPAVDLKAHAVIPPRGENVTPGLKTRPGLPADREKVGRQRRVGHPCAPIEIDGRILPG